MPLDSMFIGVSGLAAYQNQIDVVSNNIANVGTNGYKGQNVAFQDLFYQSQTYATAPTQTNGGVNGQQIGLGVKIGSINTDFTQGGLQTTGVNTNLAMNGDGFFILRQPGASAQPVYTRNGAFSLNANGLLYDPSSGLAVQGYMATKGAVNQAGTPGDMTIPLGLASQAVGTGLNTQLKFGPTGDQVFDVQMGNNLDQTQWIKEAQGVQGGTPGTGTAWPTTTTIYDSLGVGHQATITYTPDATGATPGTSTMTSNAALASNPASTVVTAISATGATKTIPAPGLSVTINGTGTLATITDGTNTMTAGPGASVTIDGVKLTLGNFTAADANLRAQYGTTAATNGLPGQVADGTGNLHSVASRWKVSVSFNDGTQISTLTSAGNGATAPTFGNGTSGVVGYAYFDQNGQYVNTSSYVNGTAPGAGQPTVIGAAGVHTAGLAASSLAGDNLNILAWGTGNTNNSIAPTAGGVAPATGPIGMDFSKVTSLSSTSNATTLNQNGFGAGTLSNITVGADGTITGAFTNGQNQILGRVAVATFANENGLDRIGGSNFQQTANSGLAQVGTAGTGRFGSVVSGSLEQSNVSIADQFTKMIAAQNAYQANSKSITVASEDLQTVTGLIR
jgi:flagellar hook protein FlgE